MTCWCISFSWDAGVDTKQEVVMRIALNVIYLNVI